MKKRIIFVFVSAIFFIITGCETGNSNQPMIEDSSMVKLVTLDPGHFHAALVQKSMYPGIDSTVNVYAPEGDEVKSHLALVSSYNERKENPTHWIENVYTGTDFLEKMVTDKKGNVVVMAGNNQRKTEYINRAVQAGMNVLGDKPMAIDTGDFELLTKAFDDAAKKKVLLYDIMTERSEITNILQRELSMMPEVFGAFEKGSPDSPSVVMESVHHFYKFVSGSALKRPAWFFDASQQGNAIVDVGTHLVDLVQWECFPEIAIDYKSDVKIQSAKKWPAPLTISQFKDITKMDSFPGYLKKYVVKDSILNADANGSVNYAIKGIHIKTTALWNYKAPDGSGDTHYSMLRGTKANLVIRQGKDENYQPTLYVEPNKNAGADYQAQLENAIKKINGDYAGVSIEKSKNGWKCIIPDSFKIGHEAHFAQVMGRFLQYLKAGKLPEWEIPGMLSKYYITTFGSAMAEAPKK